MLTLCPIASVTKADNVPWLANLPASWKVVRSLTLFSVGAERARPDDEHLSATQAYGVIPLAEYERLEGRQIVKTLLHEERRRHVEVGDFVISMRSFQGGLERVWQRGSVRSSYVVLHPSSRVHVGFFAHLFKSQPFIQALRATANFIRDGQDLSLANFKLVDLPLVPLAQQARIADYLDRKTAAIDALIEKKQQLVELLAEKRAALTHQAVTKGLDPNVPMKSSGIPWIGDIPAHWEVKRTRFLCYRIKTGTTPPTSEPQWYTDGSVPWFGPSSFRSDSISLSEPKALLSPDVWKFNVVPRFVSGTVLVVGIGATLGKVAYLEHAGSANQQVLALEFSSGAMSPRYAAYQFKYRETVFRDLAQYTTLPIMNQEGVADHASICPPLREQAAIVDQIDGEMRKLDQVFTSCGEQIARLQEYRQALITAAVTGQLEIPEAVQ